MSNIDLSSRAVPYEVSLGCLGVQRKVQKDRVKISNKGTGEEQDQSSLMLSKELLACPELDAIRALDGEIRTYVYKRALPSFRRKGIYLIPATKIAEIDSRMEEFRAQRGALVSAFCDVYEGAKEKAKARLAGLYDERDYAPIEKVRDAFYMTTAYPNLGVANQLESYPEIFEREKQRVQKQWEETAQEVQNVLRQGLKELVDHMVDRLKGNGDGKPKVFRDTMVANFQEYLDLFEPKNVTDDADLAALVQKCRGLLTNIDPQALRDTPSIRKSVTAGMESVKQVLDTLVVDQAARKTLEVD